MWLIAPADDGIIWEMKVTAISLLGDSFGNDFLGAVKREVVATRGVQICALERGTEKRIQLHAMRENKEKGTEEAATARFGGETLARVLGKSKVLGGSNRNPKEQHSDSKSKARQRKGGRVNILISFSRAGAGD